MNPKRDFIVGLTALMGLAGLAAMLLVFGELTWFKGDRSELVLVLPDAKGAETNDWVTLNGVEVGRVRRTSTFDDPRRGVEITLAIDRRVRVPHGVEVAIERDLLGSSRVVMTTRHVPEGGAPPAADADFFQPGDRFEREAQGMLEQIGSMIDERLASLRGAAESFERLSETYVRVGESIERLVAPSDAPGAPATNLPDTLARLDGAIAAARRWLDDDQFRTDAKTAMEGARETLTKLAEAVDAWSETARTLERSAERLGAGFDDGLREFVRATSALNDALAEIQIVAEAVSAGEGTLGQLVNNPDLYRSLNDAAMRLETTLREAQLLIEKFRKEGVPVQF